MPHSAAIALCDPLRFAAHLILLAKGNPLMPSLQISDEQDVVVVAFKDVTILDDTLIQQIGNEFKDLTLQASSGGKLLLDFSRVGFMSSAMIGQIVKLHKNCKRDKVRLKLCKISPNIFEVFQIT